jgi:hypothetical protein
MHVSQDKFRGLLFAAGLALGAAVFFAPGTGLSQTEEVAPPVQSSPVQFAPPEDMGSKKDAQAQIPPAVEEVAPLGEPKTLKVPEALEPREGEMPPETPTPLPSTHSPGAIEIDSLQGVDLDAAGVLSKEEGGFGDDMWNETTRELVVSLMPKLPIDTSSPVMRDMMRRLLLSRADAPKAKDGATLEKSGLATMRVGLLASMGDLLGVNQLLEVISSRDQNDKLARIEVDLRFLANDNARACSMASEMIGRQDTPYWQKAFIFCQALNGEKDKAALGMEILQETGEDDPVFLTLIEALLLGSEATIDTMPNPAPLHLALARVAGATLPIDAIESNNPAILRTIAVTPNASVEIRLEAAERAEAAGALPVDALRQLYASLKFSESDLASPLTVAETKSAPMGRALLYRTAVIQTIPTAQAEVTAKAMEMARQGGRYDSAVRVFMPVLKRIPPSVELSWFAPDAIYAFLTGQDIERAKVWFELLWNNARFDQSALSAYNSIVPVVRLAGVMDGVGVEQDELRAWWAEIKTKAEVETEAEEKASLLYSLLDAMGEEVSTDLWEPLLGGAQRTMVPMPVPALWHRLASAASAGKIGETVLLAMLALGEGGPQEAAPVIIHRVIASLRYAGLEREARAMAIEAATAARL